MAQIICHRCNQRRQHLARGLCSPCYHAVYRQVHILYFQQYRARDAYKEQREQYDIRYALKSDMEGERKLG